MFRALVVSVGLMLSSAPAFAQIPGPANLDEQIKVMANCDVEKSAKHLLMVTPAVLIAVLSDDAHQVQFNNYLGELMAIKTCEDADRAYNSLLKFFKDAQDMDAEEYFKTPEVQEQLKSLIEQLKTIKD